MSCCKVARERRVAERVFNVTQPLLCMMATRWGRVINIPPSRRSGNVAQANYAAAKADCMGEKSALSRQPASRNRLPGHHRHPMSEARSTRRQSTMFHEARGHA